MRYSSQAVKNVNQNLCNAQYTSTEGLKKVKVKQSHYSPGVAQRVPES